MFETAGGLGMPVAIHVSDPDAFFTPTDRINERYEELSNGCRSYIYNGEKVTCF